MPSEEEKPFADEEALKAKYFGAGAEEWKSKVIERLVRALGGTYSEGRDPLEGRGEPKIVPSREGADGDADGSEDDAESESRADEPAP